MGELVLEWLGFGKDELEGFEDLDLELEWGGFLEALDEGWCEIGLVKLNQELVGGLVH